MKCANHMKPATCQMSDVDLRLVRERVTQLVPPAVLGGVLYIDAELPLSAKGPYRGMRHPPIGMVTVDVWVYVKVRTTSTIFCVRP